MAANTIGSHAFDLMTGEIQFPATVVEKLPRRGRHYIRSRHVGTMAADSQLTTVEYFANQGLAEDAQETTYPQLRGTVVTIYNANNQQFDNCTILNYRVVEFRKVLRNGSDAWRVVAEWVVNAGEP